MGSENLVDGMKYMENRWNIWHLYAYVDIRHSDNQLPELWVFNSSIYIYIHINMHTHKNNHIGII